MTSQTTHGKLPRGTNCPRFAVTNFYNIKFLKITTNNFF